MTMRRSLGKGLDALIPEDKGSSESKKDIMEIDINSIFPNEDQPRKNFDQEKLNELSESIKEHGVIQPLLVKKEGEYYRIVAGERRWRAAKIAGIKMMPVVVRDLSEKEIMELSLIENLQREDLNPIEEAEAYKKLMDEFNLTQDEISKRIGKSRPKIANAIRLLNLDIEIIQMISDGLISEGHGKVILSIEDKSTQVKIADTVIKESLNVRQTENLVKAIIEGKGEKKEKKEIKGDIFIDDLQEKLINKFGTKVLISNGKKKGKIEIEYYSKEDLQRIMDILKI